MKKEKKKKRRKKEEKKGEKVFFKRKTMVSTTVSVSSKGDAVVNITRSMVSSWLNLS